MSRIGAKFFDLRREGKKAFIPFITAGDPDLSTSLKLVLELDRSGADIIELGVPFSDPMADGVIIQRASERALKNKVSVWNCLDLVRQIRDSSEVPIVLFSYFNPLLTVPGLGAELRRAGVDGILVTDLVPEEGQELVAEMRAADVDTIFLIAPTSTDERIRLVTDSCTGFLYAVSRAGVTGVRESLSESAASLTRRARQFTDLPIAVGFGISTPEHVAEVWQHADAAVVGSRIVAEIESCAAEPDLVERIGTLSCWLAAPRNGVAPDGFKIR